MNFLQYIKGVRKGKNAHRLEMEAMKDPFLAESLEGYDSVKGEHAGKIAELQQRIIAATTRKRNFRIMQWSVAAGLILCIGLGCYFLMHTPFHPLSEEIAMVDKDTFLIQQPFFAEQDTPLVSDSTETEVLAAEEDTPVVPDMKKQKVLAVKKRKKENATRQEADPSVEDAVLFEEENLSQDIELNDTQLVVAEDTSMDEPVVACNDTRENTVTAKSVNMASHAVQPQAALPVLSTVPVPEKGYEAYLKYLKKHLKHPVDSLGEDIKGEVLLEFNVDTKGRPIFIRVKKSLCPSADKEAIRLVEKGPKWTKGDGTVLLKIKF